MLRIRYKINPDQIKREFFDKISVVGPINHKGNSLIKKEEIFDQRFQKNIHFRKSHPASLARAGPANNDRVNEQKSCSILLEIRKDRNKARK